MQTQNPIILRICIPGTLWDQPMGFLCLSSENKTKQPFREGSEYVVISFFPQEILGAVTRKDRQAGKCATNKPPLRATSSGSFWEAWEPGESIHLGLHYRLDEGPTSSGHCLKVLCTFPGMSLLRAAPQPEKGQRETFAGAGSGDKASVHGQGKAREGDARTPHQSSVFGFSGFDAKFLVVSWHEIHSFSYLSLLFFNLLKHLV